MYMYVEAFFLFVGKFYFLNEILWKLSKEYGKIINYYICCGFRFRKQDE